MIQMGKKFFDMQHLIHKMEQFIYSKNVFTLQKKIVRAMVHANPGSAYKGLFRRLEILPLPYEYICSLMNFIVNNPEKFRTNSAVRITNLRNKFYLHGQITNLSFFQKSA
jgi:hypothetical protein